MSGRWRGRHNKSESLGEIKSNCKIESESESESDDDDRLTIGT